MATLDHPRRGRPKKKEVMETLTMRLPKKIVTNIDLYLECLQEQLLGLDLTRADAIRQLLAVGLREEEKRLSHIPKSNHMTRAEIEEELKKMTWNKVDLKKIEKEMMKNKK